MAGRVTEESKTQNIIVTGWMQPLIGEPDYYSPFQHFKLLLTILWGWNSVVWIPFFYLGLPILGLLTTLHLIDDLQSIWKKPKSWEY